jgi:hypothetical protein
MNKRTINRQLCGPALRLAGGLGLLSVALYAAPHLSASPIFGDISLNVRVDDGPPAPRHEEIDVRNRPGADYVWTEGFWDGSPGHYVWVAGRWDHPPHPNARWIAPHWDKDHDGHYHQSRGEWR